MDFGRLWGEALTAWTAPGLLALRWWTDDGRRAAYTPAISGRKWRMILAKDPEPARDVIATIRAEGLEQHPDGRLARHALDPACSSAEVNPSDAAMACELTPGALCPLLETLGSGDRGPGASSWSVPFLLVM